MRHGAQKSCLHRLDSLELGVLALVTFAIIVQFHHWKHLLKSEYGIGRRLWFAPICEAGPTLDNLLLATLVAQKPFEGSGSGRVAPVWSNPHGQCVVDLLPPGKEIINRCIPISGVLHFGCWPGPYYSRTSINVSFLG